ncbi:MAG: hypothetical protein JW804_03065 [Sedimentisphaerales bacterium]|nr:hypothetical protein [Sedimentisphaerales bacterium]
MTCKTDIQLKTGFTIVEMIIASAVTALLILGAGMALFHSQNNFEHTYQMTNSDAVADAYAAKRAFEATVRQSSVSLRPPSLSDSGDFIELYSYKNLKSNTIDSYVRFYLEDDKLLVTYGQLADSTYAEVVTAETGYVETSSSTTDAFMKSSAALTGNKAELTRSDAVMTSQEAVAYLEQDAFATLFNEAVTDTAVQSVSSVTSESAGSDSSESSKSGTMVLAKNIKSVKFSVNNSIVQMILTVEQHDKTVTIIASAMRHSG